MHRMVCVQEHKLAVVRGIVLRVVEESDFASVDADHDLSAFEVFSLRHNDLAPDNPTSHELTGSVL